MAVRSAHSAPGYTAEDDIAFVIGVIGSAVLALGVLLWVFG